MSVAREIAGSGYPIRDESADEFRGDMLGIGSAAAVSKQQNLSGRLASACAIFAAVSAIRVALFLKELGFNAQALRNEVHQSDVMGISS